MLAVLGVKSEIAMKNESPRVYRYSRGNAMPKSHDAFGVEAIAVNHVSSALVTTLISLFHAPV